MSLNVQTDELVDPFDPATATGLDADVDIAQYDIELRYRWAMAAVRSGRIGSAQKAASRYRLAHSTLGTRLLGVKSRQEAHEHQ
jgi:hypothetical protein